MITWNRATETYVNADNSSVPLVLFASTVTLPSSWIPVGFQWGIWNSVDLTPFGVTSDAVWADIAGIMIITGAGELEMSTRAPGSTWSAANYDQQCLSADSSGGQRQVTFETTPLVNGVFQFWAQAYTYPRGGTTFPPGGGVGFNLKLKRWAR